MAQKPFGMILAEARERQGMDIEYAAQQLRIRADILHAIENNDFARMPARGYTRNMVNAYARLLGLNAPSVTRQYLDEANSYQHSLRDGDMRSARSGRPARSGRGDQGRYDNRGRSSGGRPYRSGDDQGLRNDRGRITYSDRPERSMRTGSRAVSYQRQPRDMRSRRSSQGRSYSGGYSNNQGGSLLEKLPIIIGAVVIVILLVFIVTQIVSCASPKQTATTSVPITGVTDTTGSDDASNTNTANANANVSAVVESPPTSVAVSYTVKSGYSTYAEFYENGSDVATSAEILTGPTTGAFTVTDKLTINVVNPDAITLTVDGQEVEMTLDSSTSMYTYTVDFASVLDAWTQAHKTNTSNTASNANKTNTANTNANTNTNKTTSTSTTA